MYYEEPEIEAGSAIAASAFFSGGYDTCGARNHYLGDYDAASVPTYSNLQAFHPIYNLRNSLYYRREEYDNGDPNKYIIELDPAEELDLGRY
jgi:hypothetical protein